MSGRKAHDKRALQQAISRGEKVALPSLSRSLTAAEATASNRKIVPLALGFYFVVTLGLSSLVVFDLGTANDGIILWLLPMILLGGLFIYLLANGYRQRRSRRYFDPQISIEANDRSIIVRRPGTIHEIDYRDVEFELVEFRHRGTASFLGMIMQSPFGPLQLQDGWFKGGTATGAVVIQRWSLVDGVRRRA